MNEDRHARHVRDAVCLLVWFEAALCLVALGSWAWGWGG